MCTYERVADALNCLDDCVCVFERTRTSSSRLSFITEKGPFIGDAKLLRLKDPLTRGIRYRTPSSWLIHFYSEMLTLAVCSNTIQSRGVTLAHIF